MDNMDDTKDKAGDEKKPIDLKELTRLLEGGVTTVAELRGITREELEAVYALAHDYYRTGRYDDAETLFRALTMLDHLNEKYWMGLGAVHQVKKQWDEAVKVYAMVSGAFDLKNVKAPYYAAECFLAKGDRVNAKAAIEHVKLYADVKTEVGRAFRAKALRLEKLMATAAAG